MSNLYRKLADNLAKSIGDANDFADLSDDNIDFSKFGIEGKILADELLAPFTWFRVGGRAEVLFLPKSEDDLAKILQALPENTQVTVLGAGSNVIVRDGGIKGLVIKLSPRGFGFIERVEDEKFGANCIKVGAAVPDVKLASFALEEGLDGFSFYRGIPGTIGGAVKMNAGAHGSETKDVLKYVFGFTTAGEFKQLSLEDLKFSYRKSAIGDDFIVTSALFQGEPADKELIKGKMEEVIKHREMAQPIKEKTGGSTFKNPENNSAWKVIDKAGLRGFKLGGAMMSEKHCNFMINYNNATANDLESLGEMVIEKVKESSGIMLEWEIKRLGIKT